MLITMIIEIGRKMVQNCQKNNQYIMTKKLQELLHVITILKETNYSLFDIFWINSTRRGLHRKKYGKSGLLSHLNIFCYNDFLICDRTTLICTIVCVQVHARRGCATLHKRSFIMVNDYHCWRQMGPSESERRESNPVITILYDFFVLYK